MDERYQLPCGHRGQGRSTFGTVSMDESFQPQAVRSPEPFELLQDNAGNR